MADENSRRPYRSSESIARAGQSKPAAPGNDPLAELARLIGQSDPFGEFSRENARRAAAAQPHAEERAPAHAAPAAQPAAPAYSSQEYYAAQSAQPQAYEAHELDPSGRPYGQQGYDQAGYSAPAHHDGAAYAENGVPVYPASGAYDPQNPPYAVSEHDLYDDVPPSKRRMGIMAIAGIFALAVIGTAGAFGYRAVFGSSHAGGPPPVIKADTAPSKLMPAAASKDAQSNKLITDRINGPQGEKLVSREETPVDRPPVGPDNDAAAGPDNNGAASTGSAGEPKKIRTIAIRPDQIGGANMADAAPVAASTAPSAAPLALMPEQPTRQVQTQRITATQPPGAEPQASAAPAPAHVRPVQTRPEAAQAQAQAQTSSNAPLSLNPNAAPARSSAPTRTAALPPREAAPAGHGQYGVQVSSQRSEAEAQAAYGALERKFGAQLSGKPHFIHKVDLGAKGTYYRAIVGPFATGNEATALCSSLKSAGGQCIIQRN